MLVRAFFDESGDLSLGDVFAIGGLAGPEAYWDGFAEQWSSILAAEGLGEFHMNEFENRKGSFHDWTEERKRGLLAPLTQLIVDRSIAAFGASLDLELWRSLSASERKYFVDPYLLVFQVAVQQLAQRSTSIGEDHTISFVFDRQDKYRARAEAAFSQLRMLPEVEGREKMLEVSFANRIEHPQLQAADLWVYEFRKHELNELRGRPRRTRWPMIQFAQKQQRGELLTGRVSFAQDG